MQASLRFGSISSLSLQIWKSTTTHIPFARKMWRKFQLKVEVSSVFYLGFEHLSRPTMVSPKQNRRRSTIHISSSPNRSYMFLGKQDSAFYAILGLDSVSKQLKIEIKFQKNAHISVQMAKERCEKCMLSDSVFCKLPAVFVQPGLDFDLNCSKHFGFHLVLPNSVNAESPRRSSTPGWSSPDSVLWCTLCSERVQLRLPLVQQVALPRSAACRRWYGDAGSAPWW